MHFRCGFFHCFCGDFVALFLRCLSHCLSCCVSHFLYCGSYLETTAHKNWHQLCSVFRESIRWRHNLRKITCCFPCLNTVLKQNFFTIANFNWFFVHSILSRSDCIKMRKSRASTAVKKNYAPVSDDELDFDDSENYQPEKVRAA